MQPINYLQNIPDPFAQAIAGMQLGETYAAQQQKDEQARQLALAKQQQIAQQMQQQELIAIERDRFLANPKPTMRDAMKFASLLPKDQADAIRPYIEGVSKEQQQNVLRFNGQVLSALQTNPPTGIKLLRERAAAERAGGDEQEAALYERMAETAETQGAETAFKGLTYIIASMPGAKEMFENVDKTLSTTRLEAQAPAELREKLAKATEAETKALVAVQTAPDDVSKAKALREYEQAKATNETVKAKYAEQVTLEDLKKKAADLKLTAAQTNQALATTRKLGQETQKAALELAALQATGGRDPAKTFEQEEKIRKEWQGRSKAYGELGTIYNNIKSSAESKSGQGDIALITGFMKMLDPSSVVRETEFATARDTAGTFDNLKNLLKKAESGQFLQPNQRLEFVNLSKQYLAAAQKKAEEDKKALGVVVKNYRLNPENVFGPETEPATPATLPTSATVSGVTYSRPASFTDAQWSDYLKANKVIQ
jgi:hypothetical protein